MSIYIMLNKPRGKVTARVDAKYPTVMECFEEPLRSLIHPVGRLDMDTEGFLLFTDDGGLDNALLKPEFHVAKKYFFWALGTLNSEKLKTLRDGVMLGRNGYVTQPAEIEICSVATIKDIEELISDKRKKRIMKNPTGAAVSGILNISEGKWHQVKRMLNAVGCEVVYLKRISFAGIELDSSLLPGEYRYLTEKELEVLSDAKMKYINNAK